ncbi:MAG TPA: N-formylglutamate amidohydrolase [Allosphingosinicella sp.]|jgi:N-formylglutamate amidohydrolase
MSDSPAPPPFERIGPERPASPVVLSVPHAGRDYSQQLLKAARLPRAVLETLEDRLADRLVWRATEAGATAFVARVPRAEIDLNRDEREIDPALIAPSPAPMDVLPSARTRGGIGLIPSRITGVGAIWNARISRDELARRVEGVHRPYHRALERALAAARERFGAAVLLDCHSMPPRSGASGQETVIFGDRYGTTTAPHLLDAAVAAARALGYRTACNTPYAGGYICGRHGRPDRGIHAIQIEIDRSIYLEPELRAPGPGFADACRLIETVVAALEARLFGPAQALAAE